MSRLGSKMTKRLNYRIGVVVSRFNDFITQRLLRGCVDELVKRGVSKSSILVVQVPGAWEIPVVAQQLALKKNIDAVICLGAVIRGETAHFDIVAQGSCSGIQQAALTTGKPVVLGVLTTENTKQAYARSSDKKRNNKGREAACVALEMIDTLLSLKKI